MMYTFRITSSLMLAVGVTGSLVSCQTKEKKSRDTERPNIIFIMTDDHAYQAISAYDSYRNETPNIDRIAENGMLFKQAFVSNSISSPSRAVLLTGKHSHKNGVLDNKMPFDSSQMTFPKVLRKNGYQTAMIGKWHLESNPTGFDYWKVLPGQGNYYNPDFKTPDGSERITGYITNIITDLSLNWLKEESKKDKPFLLMCHYKAPHRAWWPSPDNIRKYKDQDIKEPKTLFDDYEGRGKAAKQQEMTIKDHMKLVGDLKIKPEDPDSIYEDDPWNIEAYKSNYKRFTEKQRKQWNKVYDPIVQEFKQDSPTGKELVKWKYQRYMEDYLGCIASVDDNIGRILDYLKKAGLEENTLVVYTSDQGFYLGEHGWFDKRFMYKQSFRTPLLMQWPDVIEPGSVNRDLVQNLDFAETFLDAANAEIPESMQGKSMMPILTGDLKGDFRDALYYHYYEYPSVHSVKRHYGIRTDRYKLMHFYYDIDQWELYDMKKDPHEMNNVYNDPNYQDVVKRLKSKLSELRDKYGDSDSLQKKLLNKYLEKRK